MELSEVRRGAQRHLGDQARCVQHRFGNEFLICDDA
jgi:hypothetical protein